MLWVALLIDGLSQVTMGPYATVEQCVIVADLNRSALDRSFAVPLPSGVDGHLVSRSDVDAVCVWAAAPPPPRTKPNGGVQT